MRRRTWAASREPSPIPPGTHAAARSRLRLQAVGTTEVLAGASLPVIALTLGWRWAFVLAGTIALAVALTVRHRPHAGRQRSPEERGGPPPSPAGYGVRPRQLHEFGDHHLYVDAAVTVGTTQHVAGTTLAAISLGALATRVGSGAVADRMSGGYLRWCAGLLAGGAAGTAILATGGPAWMVVGGAIGLAGTWGFNGVFLYTLVRTSTDTAGRITGLVAPGALLGATAGSLAFGLLVEASSYAVAWSWLTVVPALASAMMLYGARRMAVTEHVEVSRRVT